ncbi:type VI secretion system protein TssA [Alphaproteobacteria bacterium]|nr:type VI secretion system protein TssA [Alphaproteobacteria bacterium]
MAIYENLDPFLQDIPGGNPQGKDAKYDIKYDQIKEATREDLDLPQGVWVQDLKSANWEEAEKLCVDILQNEAKDLQVASWLIETWVSLYNMKGIKQGFNLLLQLSEKYWDTAFPVLDPNDPEFRSAPYNWINEKLAGRFNKICITYPSDSETLSYSYSNYVDINENGGIEITSSDEKKETSNDPEGFKKSLDKTKDDFFIEFKKDGDEALNFIKSLQSLLDEKLGEGGPSLYHAQDKIQELISFCDQTLEARKKETEEKTNTTAETSPQNTELSTEENPEKSEESTSTIHVDAVMNSRSDAYSIINKAADYLEKLDPHSPSPHLIKRAIKWSNLDLKELLQEMVKEPNSLQELKHLLGMGQEPDQTDDDTGSSSDAAPPDQNKPTS